MIEKGISLKEYNTFGIDALAKDLISIRSEKDIKAFIDSRNSFDFILGGGSNVLFTKSFYETVLLNQIKGIDIIYESDNAVIIEVGSGEIWDDIVSWAVENDFGGIENMSLIPGTVGAAPIQNIGAYGVEVKDVLLKLEAIDLSTGERLELKNEDCNFGYRDSIFKNEFKGKFFITKVILKLNKSPEVNTSYGNIKALLDENGIQNPIIEDVRNVVVSIRKSKLPDPKLLGNSGSFFKNPFISRSKLHKIENEWSDVKYYPIDNDKVKLPAAWLLDKAGWKGKQIGNVGCHKNQSLVVVNYGNATGQEIKDFANTVINDIMNKFGVQLTPEVNFL